MTRFAVRLALFLACVGAIGYAAFLTWTSEQRVRAADNASRQFHTAARATSTAVAELRSAQQSYVAVGQGEDFWFARVDEIVKTLNQDLATLKSLTSVPDAVTALNEAAGALQDFEQMDRRARDYARGHQITLASDVIFTDGFDLTRKAGDAVERAATGESIARDALLGGIRLEQGAALAAAGGVSILGLLLLLPGRRTTEDAAATVTPDALPLAAASAETGDDLRDFSGVARPVAPAPPVHPTVDLGGMAALCADLARIQNTRALPALLARAADILRASGIVLWIADPDGRELSPIVVHGYPPQLSARFGTILRDAENVTASAYRTGLLQIMKGDAISNGAVAAPLVTAGGCVGVMAAELKDGGEQQPTLLAAAAIVAAQLATLVGPPSARARTEAAG